MQAIRDLRVQNGRTIRSHRDDPSTQPVEGLLAALRLALGTGSCARDRGTLLRIGDWGAVGRLATHHRVGTLLLAGVRAGGVRIADPTVEGDLALRRRRVVAHGMRQLDGMQRATVGLAALGIRTLVLKGLPLGQRLYGNPFAKHSIDIDLLVPPEAFADASRALHNLGWRQSMPDFRETARRKHWYEAVQKEHVLVGPGGKLELHRRLFGNPFLLESSFARLDESAATVEIGRCAFRTLGDADQLLYLACHGALHCWRRIKWLCDVAAFLGAVDAAAFEQVLARSRQQRLGDVVASTLVLCRDALHAAPPRGAKPGRPAGTRIRVVVDISRRGWNPGGGLRRIVLETIMRAVRVFIRPSARYSLYEMRGLLIRYRDFARVDLPDRLFWLYVPLQAVLRMARLLRWQK